MNETTLRVHAELPATRALGPGLRYALYAQGCPRRCPGCMSPESRTMDGGELVSVTELGQRILAQPDIEGLTVSGGEPLLQATALCALIDLLRRGRDLGVIVYSGYTLDELRRGGAGPGVEDLLSRIDLLVDGPYVEALNDGGGLRGSANQRAHFLTPRYARYAARYGGGQRAVELHLHRDHAFLAGIPGPETLARWRAGFSAEGPSGGSGQAVEHPKR